MPPKQLLQEAWLLLPEVRWWSKNGNFFIEGPDSQVEISGLHPLSAEKLLWSLNGTTPPIERMGVIGTESETAANLLSSLLEAGLITKPFDEDKCVEGVLLTRVCRSVFPRWREELFSYRLWVELSNGTAPWSVFLGWLIESYHFIEGVTIRLPMAICETWEPAATRVFSRHFIEEYDHHHFFQKALRNAGITDTLLARIEPLPGTRAVLNAMREAARRDPLAYAACSGFLESTGIDRDNARSFLSRLAEHYDNDLEKQSIISPLQDHLTLDENYGHGAFIEKIVDQYETISIERLEGAVQSASLLVETLLYWSRDIWDYYTANPSIETGTRAYGLKPAAVAETPSLAK